MTPTPTPEPKVSVGDDVWLDADGDGVQGAGEKPLPGVTVKLFDKDGMLVKETKTDADGYYVFTDLKPGVAYAIEFPTTVTVDGKTVPLTRPGQGGDTAKDSDADPSTGRVPFTAPLTGGNSAEPGKADNPTIDAGFAPVKDAPGLPSTGGEPPYGALVVGLGLLAGGLLLALRRRRTVTDQS